MTPDNAFYAFSSISLAATLLAFVIGFRDVDARQGLALFRLFVPESWVARRSVRQEQVMRKTQIADDAMAAKARGERFVPPKDYRGG